MNSIIKKIIQAVLTAMFWIAIWEILFIAIGKEIIVPSPFSVAKRVFELAGEWQFWKSVFMSVERISLGLVLGITAGTLMATVCRINFLQNLFTPLRTMIKATPVASFIMLAWIWLKRDSIPVFVSMLMVIPIVWGGVEMGIKSVSKDMKEFAVMYKLSKKTVLTNIYIPTILPHFSSALCTSAGLVWKAGIAAEVLCQPKNSIGANLYGAKNILNTLDVFTWTVVVIIISIILEKLIKALMGRIHKNLDMDNLK